MTGEISFDLVAEADSNFEEGACRLPCGAWRAVAAPEVRPTTWDSGVWVAFPASGVLNRAAVTRLLGEAFSVSEWVEARGPDSVALR